jgi:hypothetical protein
MKSRMLAVVICAAFVVFCASAAYAQFRTSDRSPVGVSLAIMRPTGSDFKEIGNIWLGPTLHINLDFDQFDRANAMLSFTWFGQDEWNKKSNFFPLVATYIKRFGKDAENPLYFGGGLGVYFVSYKEIPVGKYIFERYTDTKLGVHYVVGKEYGGWFFEFRHDLVPSMEIGGGRSVGLGGLSLVIGSRMAL